MRITALAPWFGSKRNLAPEVIAELGDHRSYWEPFAGSMAVLLRKAPASMEVVNDLHGDLVNLARVIQDRQLGPKLYRMLRRVLLSRELHQDSAEVIRAGDWGGEPSVERAFHYFVVSWFGRSGVAGTSSYNAGFCARYTAKGGHAATRWHSAVRSIPAWRRRLAGVTIERLDAFEMLERIEDARGAAIYCDPPYLTKGSDYVHDLEPDDHKRLAELLGRFRHARVVISYYDAPVLSELYPGWTKRTFDVSKAMAHQGGRGKNDTRATEVLLMNGLSYAEAEGLFT